MKGKGERGELAGGGEEGEGGEGREGTLVCIFKCSLE